MSTSTVTPTAHHPTIRRRSLRVTTVAVWIAVAVCATWAVVRLGGWERGWPTVQLLGATPYVAALATVLAVVALALRRWRTAVAAVIVAAALTAVVLPRATPDRAALPGGQTLRVLSANVYVGRADAPALVRLADRVDADVVTLQEYSPEFAARLDAAGIAARFPHRAAYPVEDYSGSAVFSRYPLRDVGLRRLPSGAGQAYGTVEVPGAVAVTIESVHPSAPATALSTGYWARDLPAQPAADSDGPPRILAGDFNATLDHAALRRLVGTGYREAADATGSGLRPTWPYAGTPWYIPALTLDHVLVDRRVGVRSAHIHRIDGSDHRAVFAELVLPAAS